MAPLLRDFVVELVKGFHHLVRLVQQPLNLLLLPRSLPSVVLVIATLPLLQLLNVPVVMVGHYAVSSDPDLHGFDEAVERLGAEKEDVTTRRTGVCEGVADVSPLVWWEEDTASCDEQDLLAVTAFGKVETPGTLSVRCGLGSDEEPERRSKRTANVDGWV